MRLEILEQKTSHMKFQSTPPRRVRRVKPIRIRAVKLFQSTHPRRVRLRHGNRRARNGFQSTHPRRVRRRGTQLTASVYHFNPRTRVGCDSGRRLSCFLLRIFQSTHPRRVRLTALTSFSLKRDFNPRTRVGCDFPQLFY